jgi:hypothetical protein
MIKIFSLTKIRLINKKAILEVFKLEIVNHLINELFKNYIFKN